jgi:hypothetical protein
MAPAVPRDDQRRRIQLATAAYRIVIELAEPMRFLARASEAL